MKMTDNEIIKVLGCCKAGDCDECSFYGVKEDCEVELLEEALDLINRQKYKIKEFDEKLIIQQGLIDYQKVEIEKLNIELQSMRSAANSCKMHYETVNPKQ